MSLRDGITVGVAVSCLLVATLVIFGILPTGLSSQVGLQIALTGICVLLLLRSFVLDRVRIGAGRRPVRIGSFVFAAGSLVAVALPGEQVLAGVRQSRLVLLGLHIDPVGDVQTAYLLWILALLAFVAGEELSSYQTDRTSDSHATRGPQLPALHSRATFVALLVFGAFGTIFATATGQAQTIASRGTVRGQGAEIMLEYGLPLAVCLAILTFRRDRASVMALAIASGGWTYLIWVTGARSTLILVAAAGLIMLLYSEKSKVSFRRLAICAAAIYMAASVLVAVPIWRAGVAKGASPSFAAALVANGTNPLEEIASVGGLDTLDGLVLSTKIDPQAVGASWTDPLKAIIELVPYQLWPDKPEFLGPAVTHRYLNFGGGAGIFLSGPGYAYIVFGGAAGMAIAFIVLGMISRTLFTRFSTASMPAVLLIYFLLRFIFAGDSFDLFQTIEMGIALSIAYALGALISRPYRRIRGRF